MPTPIAFAILLPFIFQITSKMIVGTIHFFVLNPCISTPVHVLIRCISDLGPNINFGV